MLPVTTTTKLITWWSVMLLLAVRVTSGLSEHALLYLCDLWPLLGNLSWGWVQEKLFPPTGVSIPSCTSLWAVSLARDPFCYNCHWNLGPKYNWIILFLTLFKHYWSNLCLCRTLCWAGRRHVPVLLSRDGVVQSQRCCGCSWEELLWILGREIASSLGQERKLTDLLDWVFE